MKRPNSRLKFGLAIILLVGILVWFFNTLQPLPDAPTLEDSRKQPFQDYTPAEQKIWDKLDPVCDFLPHEAEVKVEKVDMKLDTSGVDHKDPVSLSKFCEPYQYARLQLEWQDSTASGCAVGDKVRGTDCTWYHMCIWDPMEDIYISKNIAAGDLWESFFVNKMIKESRGVKKGIIIDAGANIGQYTILGAALGHTVFSFEPIPSHIEMIKKSLALNGWSDRVHLYQNGLGDYHATTAILAHSFNKGGATIENINQSAIPPNDGRYIQKIPLNLITLDDVLPDMKENCPGEKIVFWKADIEGYESRMFRGSVKVLNYYKPDIVAFEILGKSFAFTNCKLPELLNAISTLGYNIYELKAERLISESEFEQQALSLTSKKGDMDVIIRPKPKQQKDKPKVRH